MRPAQPRSSARWLLDFVWLSEVEGKVLRERFWRGDLLSAPRTKTDVHHVLFLTIWNMCRLIVRAKMTQKAMPAL